MLGAIPLGFIASSSGFNPTTVDQSCWFDGAADALYRQFPAAYTTKTRAVFSIWLQPTKFAALQAICGGLEGGQGWRLDRTAADLLEYQASTGIGACWRSTQSFRDIAFGHLVLSIDTTQVTGSERIKGYWNGVEIPATNPNTIGLNADAGPFVNAMTGSEYFYIGAYWNGASVSSYHSGYKAQFTVLAEVSIQNGDIAITDFGEWWPFGENGEEWAPLADADIEARANAAGGNSFALTSEIGDGTDASSNSNNFTPTSMSHAANGSSNTPSNVYAIWNELDPTDNIHSKGNQRVDGVGADFDSSRATQFVSTGKYYFEFERDVDSGGADRYRVGVSNATFPLSTTPDSRSDFWGFSENGNKIGGGAANAAYGSTHTTGAYVGVALDLDNGAIWFSVNGTWQAGATVSEIEAGTTTNAAFTNVSGEVTPTANLYSTEACTLRTTESSWEGTPPAGFVALCTANLPTPEHQGCDHFNTLLYTGTGAALSVTGNGFQPDFNWIKNRSAADSHVLTDVIRGVGEILSSDTTAAEATDADTVTAFGSDGFSLGADVKVNTNTENYVSWNWKVGVAPVANTDGSIASQVSVSPAKHFGIVSYTGVTGGPDTVGHGFGETPDAVIVKRTTLGVANWAVLFTELGATSNLILNGTSAATNNLFGGALPDSTTFTVGNNAETNSSGSDYVAYLFRSVPGLCKVGKYTGNGLADGPYVHLGFKPRWIMFKQTNAANGWYIHDTARDTYNPSGAYLVANSSGAEASLTLIDILSDGFKIRSNSGTHNGTNIVYIAIADIAGGGDLPPIPGR